MKTTDNQSELFDLVNEMDEVIGQITRKQAHSDPKNFHRSVGILLFNKKGQLYIQKRSLTKDMEPGKWSISAAGHVISGQSPHETALREVKEELGVIVETVEFMGKYIVSDPHETEIASVFKTYHEGPFRHHPQEVAGGMFIALDELERQIVAKEREMTIGSLMNLREVLGILKDQRHLEQYISKRF